MTESVLSKFTSAVRRPVLMLVVAVALALTVVVSARAANNYVYIGSPRGRTCIWGQSVGAIRVSATIVDQTCRANATGVISASYRFEAAYPATYLSVSWYTLDDGRKAILLTAEQ